MRLNIAERELMVYGNIWQKERIEDIVSVVLLEQTQNYSKSIYSNTTFINSKEDSDGKIKA